MAEGADSEFLDPVDDADWLPARALFRRLGYEPLSPAHVDDSQLPGRLWEFIYALAARRFYLYWTNHLTDRELYVWLHDRWFDEDVADLPPESEWNCRIAVSEFGSGSGSGVQTWLRYYADDKERADWAVEHPEDHIPPRAAFVSDRDQWLPEPPVPEIEDEMDEDSFDLDEDAEGEGEGDPLGLVQVDAAIRAEKRRQESASATAGDAEGLWQRPIDRLREDGLGLLPPDELTDDTFTAKLWELLHHLACRGFYLLHTDHLSDRELYTELWRRGLRAEAMLPGRSRTCGWFHDFIGSGSDEDVRVWLQYYASDDDRVQYAVEHPGESMPPRAPLAASRDWRLPKGPF